MTVQNYPIEETRTAVEGATTPERPGNSDPLSLIAVLTQLACRKWLILKVAGVGALAGLILCFVTPVRFTATTRIMTPRQTQSSAMIMASQLANSGAGSLAAAAAGGGISLKNPNDLYIGLLESRPLADAIIGKFQLMNEYHAHDMTAARLALKGYTEVDSEKSGFIVISVTDKDRKRAAELANAYTDELRNFTQTLAVTEASQRRLFYEEQLKQAKEALVEAALGFQQVQQRNGVVALDAQAKAMIEGLAALRAQVAAKQVEVQALRSYSTEQNPDVQLAEKELASLQDEEGHLEQRNHAPGIAGLGLENVPSAGLEYLRAEHELEYRQTLFDLLIKQLDAARMDEAKDAAVIQVVEPAIEPDRKTSPKRLSLMIQMTGVGFLAGCLLALFPWWKQMVLSDPDRARSIQDLKSVLSGRNVNGH
jgi:uncharacterized protein involved in exopolysaccharide biosynthesis